MGKKIPDIKPKIFSSADHNTPARNATRIALQAGDVRTKIIAQKDYIFVARV